MSNLTNDTWPACAATCNGFLEVSSSFSISAPCCSKSRATRWWPFAETMCKALAFSSGTWPHRFPFPSTTAPLSSNSWTRVTSPEPQAIIRTLGWLDESTLTYRTWSEYSRLLHAFLGQRPAEQSCVHLAEDWYWHKRLAEPVRVGNGVRMHIHMHIRMEDAGRQTNTNSWGTNANVLR